MSYTLAFSKSQSSSHPSSSDSSWMAFPTPKHGGVTVSKNKIWSTNTGRKANAEMTGTLVGIKKKLEIEFPPNLTEERISSMDGFISDKDKCWQWVKYTNESGSTNYFRGYWGDGVYPQYGFLKGKMIISGLKCSFVEK